MRLEARVTTDYEYPGTDTLETMREAVNYNRFLVTLIRSYAHTSDKIADFGAGLGTYAAPLAQAGFDVTCVEPDSRNAAAIAAQGLPVVDSSAALPAQGIDYAYSLNVLEHIVDDGAALREWVSRLKYGGRMLLYVPAFNLLFSSMDRHVGHQRRYTRSSLAAVARTAGLTVERTRYVDCAGFMAALLYRALRIESGEVNVSALRAFDRYAFPASRIGDLALGHFFGKNVLLVGRRYTSAPAA
jgi:SAM-dependent methyltransferase